MGFFDWFRKRKKEPEPEARGSGPRRLVKCNRCGKAFENTQDDPADAAIRSMLSVTGGDENVAAMFGLGTKVFTCPHCGNKARM